MAAKQSIARLRLLISRNKRLIYVLIVLVLVTIGVVVEQLLPQPAPLGVQHEVSTIIRQQTNPNLGWTFPGIKPSQLKKAASYSFRAGGKTHEIDSFYESFSRSDTNQAAQLYANSLAGAINFATSFPNVALAIFNSNNSYQPLVAHLSVINHTAWLIMAGNKAITTDFSQQDSSITGAATFLDQVPPKNYDASFVDNDHNYFDVNAAVSTSTEACQAALTVTTGQGASTTAQEIFCNSLGSVFADALLNQSYTQYVAGTKHSLVDTIELPSSSKFMRYFVVPKAAYLKIEHFQTPSASDMTGIQLIGCSAATKCS